MDQAFNIPELKALQWAVQVAADAVTIKSASGEMPDDDAMLLVEVLTVLEGKIDELIVTT